MDEEHNPENTEEDIEFLEDDFVEVVDLDGGGETEEGTKQLYQVECTWRFDLNSNQFLHLTLLEVKNKDLVRLFHCHTLWLFVFWFNFL